VEKQSDIAELCVMDVSSTLPELKGTVAGTFADIAPGGLPLVEVSGVRLLARSCVQLHVRDVGKEVLVTFDSAHPETPIVLGVLQPPIVTETVEVTADGKNVALSAHDSITLRCGDASITLNREGKIVIRGAHVVTHASGVNRIRGASVELN
jgi:Domain of unknown function (DUF6484)